MANHCHPRPNVTDGFTIIELLISIAVIAILLAITAPSFKNMIMNNRVTSVADEFTSGLNYARNTALTQNMSIITCPFGGVDSTSCGTNWQNGWSIISQPASGTPVLLSANSAGSNNPILSSTTAAVTFDAHGIATTASNFTICDSRGAAFAQSIEVLPTGFVVSGANMGVAAWDGGGLLCP
jgi:type IV fimbrial biogenesis protein FimT